jgi:alpha-mannosidase
VYRQREIFEKVRWELNAKIYTALAELQAEVYVTKEPVPFEKRESGTHKKLKIGDSWGELFDCGWFRFQGEVPKSAAGKKVLCLLDISGEGLAFDDNGNPVRAITNKNSGFDLSHGHPGKLEILFKECAAGGERVDFWLDAGCNDLFGNLRDDAKLLICQIAAENTLYKKLYYDYEFVLSLWDGLIAERNIPYAKEVYAELKKAVKKIRNSLNNSVANEIIDGFSRFIENGSQNEGLNITALGHAHIDLAWLWPIRETKRKGARTFATALQLMDEYPEYLFGASQAQLFKWMKEEYPDLYARIKKKVEEKRIEVQGAMWVEPDSNLLSLESLIRQILYGKKFFKEEFGLDMEMMWVPDSFGYSGALPQILKKSGVEYFMTQKMSWNRTNKFPYHTFIWKGIDGSEILSHMLPSNTYNGSLAPRDVLFAKNNFAEKKVSREILYLFGIGDGGGGPGIEHLERFRRYENNKTLPKMKMGFAIDFFKEIEKDKEKYPVHSGELYLEKHQGTYTTQAKNKK